MKKDEFKNAIEEVLSETRDKWVDRLKTKANALRWWVAVTEARQHLECNTVEDWARLFLRGVRRIPTKVFDYTWDTMADGMEENEQRAVLEDLRAFYSKTK